VTDRTPEVGRYPPAGGAVALGKKAKASLVATIRLENALTPDRKNPFRCTFVVSVVDKSDL